jgi:exosortase A
MKRDLDLAITQPPKTAAVVTIPVLACALVAVGIVAMYWNTAASIVLLWTRSETFAHGFVVVPISLWFAWRVRGELSLVPASPWWPGLCIVAAAGAAWTVAAAADVDVVKQFALVFMVEGAIVSIVGLRVARAAAFPLAFLFFAVPFGEFLIPTLMDWTADFTVAALRLSGLPVYREGNHFNIPSGTWSVVEACSGVRYVIASLMVGTIFATIVYRSAKRRALFVLVSLLVPVVANWLRAYMIVMIGHLSNNRLAVGIDHLIYGWLFFGVVMLIMFWVGSRWQESLPPRPATVATIALHVGERHSFGRASFAVCAAALLVAGIWPLIDGRELGVEHSKPAVPAIEGAGGWQPQPANVGDWRPKYGGYASDYRQTYGRADKVVGMHVMYYRDQRKGAELVTSMNSLTAANSSEWNQLSEGRVSVAWSGRQIDAQRALLRGRSTTLEVFALYRVAGQTTSSPHVAKALLAWSRLTGRGDDAALIVLFAPVRRESPGSSATATLQDFAQAMSPSIDRTLAAVEASRR